MSVPLRIAYLLTQSLDSPSGLGRYWPLARELAELGHQIEIFALHPDYSNAVAQPFQREGVQIHYVAPMHVRKLGSDKQYYSPAQMAWIVAQSTARLATSAWRSQAEILHIGKPHPMNGLAGLLGRMQGRKTLFVDCDDYEAGSNRFSGGWQKAGVAAFERRIPRLATAVTTNTGYMRQKLVDWGVPPERIHYLPNGVDLQRFASFVPGQEIELRSQWGLTPDQKTVLYLGSLSLASHAVDLLVEAFSIVHASAPDARLLIVGGGEDNRVLSAQAQQAGLGEQVIFTGRVPPDQAAVCYHLAEVSVDPVRDDEAARGRSPLKMFESWACEAPFVTSDVGDRRMLLGEPPAGILTQPGNAPALAEAILQVLRQPALAAELSQRGLARLPEFTWAKLVKRLDEVYRRNV
jgi:glycosyltransferase involved in cell wall biosynthesis